MVSKVGMREGIYLSNTLSGRKVIYGSLADKAWSSPSILAEVKASKNVTLRDRNHDPLASVA